MPEQESRYTACPSAVDGGHTSAWDNRKNDLVRDAAGQVMYCPADEAARWLAEMNKWDRNHPEA